MRRNEKADCMQDTLKADEHRVEKPLSQMTLNELWQLFPIQLTAHQPHWSVWYQEEKELLARILPGNAVLHHIGSTAISGIWAKPIVDILAEVDLRDFRIIKHALTKCGYLCMVQDKARADFNKGYTPDGFADKVFHLHLRSYGDCAELYFRDYLNQCPEIAKQYEALKLSLWKQFEHDRDGYTQAKAAFVCRYTQQAKQRMQSSCGVYGEESKPN